METKHDVELMVKVAEMYYLDGLKQEEIAKQLKISRSLISMMLTEAKEVGIVEVNIRNPMLNNNELAKEIQLAFGVKHCIVIPTAVQDSRTVRKLVAQRAIHVFNNSVTPQSTVGVAWGRTCYEFISNFKTNRVLKAVEIVPLIGGSNQTAHYFQLNEMVRLFAQKLKANPSFIHAPALTASRKEYELYMKSVSMRGILEKWNALDMIISGIGTLPNLDHIDRETYTGEYEIFKQLEANNAIGDICARYFDCRGQFIIDQFYHQIIGIPVEQLKKTPKIICIASGLEKERAILGALNTRVIDTLISDEQTIRAVLKTAKLLAQDDLAREKKP